MKIQSALLVILLFSSTFAMSQTDDSCTIGDLPVVSFKKGHVFLNAAAKAVLNKSISLLKKNATCKIKLEGHGSATYKAQQMSWDRVKSVQDYLLKKGIDHSRIIFEFGAAGNPLTVDLIASPASMEGPSTVPSPIPCLSFHHKGKRCVDKHGNPVQ